MDEVLPECLDCRGNSISELLSRIGGRIWRGNLRVQANNETKVINVFRVTKTVLVLNQWAVLVDNTALTNCTNVYATAWDGSTSIDLTADGIDLSGLQVGTTFFKDKEPAQPYSMLASNGVVVYEPTEKKEGQPFYVQQKNGADTFIRFHVTTNTVLDFTIYMEFTYKLFNGAKLEMVA